METQIVTTLDRVDLFVRQYFPSNPDPARVFFWVHGLGEHGGRHEHLANVMTRRGWTLIIPDLRGHGKSGGIPTHVDSFNEYVNDIGLIWDQLGLESSVPVLLGHSMGGLIAVRAVQERRVIPSVLVLSSPLLGLRLRINPVKELLGRILVRWIPRSRFSNGIDPANMTRDSEFAGQRRSDPLINKTVTAAWFFSMKSALDSAIRDASLVTLPVFALQGSGDQTTDPTAFAEWWNRIASTEKDLVLLPDHLHELFFEPDWCDTTNRILDWLERR